MFPQLAPLAHIARLNERLFVNCLQGVDDRLSRRRPSRRANSIGFVAVHLVDARCFLVRLLGGSLHSPYEAALADVTRIEEMRVWPTVAGLRRAWRAAGRGLTARLEAAAPSLLGRPAPHRFPVGEPTVLGGVAFLLQHEAYHIGQMALLRKALGLGPMSYR